MDHHHEDKNAKNKLTDPVCGMTVIETSKFYEKVDRKTFYFCRGKCQLKFKNSPASYIKNLEKATAAKESQKGIGINSIGG